MRTATLICGAFALSVAIAAVQDSASIDADLACETARELVRLQQQQSPPASDKCSNCNGTGKIGDGRIVLQCPVCKGTGKK
jgi:DnaJ-class molecular chaperone